MQDPRAYIDQMIKAHPIVLFMKGSASFPQCGFSAAIVEILAQQGVPVHTVDVLQDPEVRQEIKIYSDWPTVPQLYVGGTFIGGFEIVRGMHKSGELSLLLAAVQLHATG